MKWGVQQVRVTLEDESGETLVIEQDGKGNVKCAPTKAGKAARAAEPPAKERAQKVKADDKAEEKPKTEDKGKGKGKAEIKVKDDVKPVAAKSKAAARKPRRVTTLKWLPVMDHEYEGFMANASAGRFKVLKTRGSQWALFYEMTDTWPKNLGCFRKLDPAKVRAQELHDSGWPESEFGPVTAGQVAQACPMPIDERDEEQAAAASPVDVEEQKPAPPSTSTPAANDAEGHKELMGSFRQGLDSMLDEDEDD